MTAADTNFLHIVLFMVCLNINVLMFCNRVKFHIDQWKTRRLSMTAWVFMGAVDAVAQGFVAFVYWGIFRGWLS